MVLEVSRWGCHQLDMEIKEFQQAIHTPPVPVMIHLSERLRCRVSNGILDLFRAGILEYDCCVRRMPEISQECEKFAKKLGFEVTVFSMPFAECFSNPNYTGINEPELDNNVWCDDFSTLKCLATWDSIAANKRTYQMLSFARTAYLSKDGFYSCLREALMERAIYSQPTQGDRFGTWTYRDAAHPPPPGVPQSLIGISPARQAQQPTQATTQSLFINTGGVPSATVAAPTPVPGVPNPTIVQQQQQEAHAEALRILQGGLTSGLQFLGTNGGNTIPYFTAHQQQFQQLNGVNGGGGAGGLQFGNAALGPQLAGAAIPQPLQVSVNLK
ncbi:hypothetical protein GCK72_011530 [Caenorhabditis remanei]|uniref:Uncharacterized protein n=1 Tax=Caenorhabditis remanei TaxID=31234 RepID=A0A6A5H8Z7_CAERE|nr:hypothetical protein GCK72_011530 [Caenorhabditis remanei]KAF1763264.1 hypothetical protein GCK72_011530 [Caenorhabditis remanei]